MDEYGIAAFRSRQQVLRFEEALRREGLNVKVISTPRDVAVGCGLSVQFRPADIQMVRRVLERTNPGNLIGLYLVDHRGGGRPRLTTVSKRN